MLWSRQSCCKFGLLSAFSFGLLRAYKPERGVICLPRRCCSWCGETGTFLFQYFCFTLCIMSAPEGQEPAVDPQPTGEESMSKKEAMEQFAQIFEILNGLTGQTNQTSQSQGTPSAAARVAGSSESMGEKSMQSTLPSITTQAGSSQSAIAPTFLQVVQQPSLISAPAQNLSAPGGGAPMGQPWQLVRAQQIYCKPKRQCQLCRCHLPCFRSQATWWKKFRRANLSTLVYCAQEI